jgi:4-carboxymuconolactone decarboxylase
VRTKERAHITEQGDRDDQTSMDQKVKENLERIKLAYGQIPFITDQISKRPEIFLGYAEFSRTLLFEPKHLDQRTMELAAVAAGSALGAEHCLDIHLKQAAKHGASDEQIFEAIMVGAFMAMTKSQASALRRFKEFQDHQDGS